MKTNFSTALGMRLREVRQSRAVSQEQLAHIANITPAYLGQVERGTKNITVHMLDRICQALNITLCDFFEFDSKQDSGIDDICSQILHQLHNKPDIEKQAVLKLVKLVFSIKDM